MIPSDDRSRTDGNSSSAQGDGPTAAGVGNSEQAKAVRRDASTGSSDRNGFGDDMGTRVGRPDAGRSASDDNSARLSENAITSGLEGAILEGGDNVRSQAASASSSSAGDRSRTRADGSAMTGENQHEGQTLDHAQRAASGTPQQSEGSGDSAKGAGAEASRGVEGAQAQRGTDEGSDERSGSEPLEGRTKEHKPGYGGEGGEPRTSSDQRERPGAGS